jgi:hypothetical protein
MTKDEALQIALEALIDFDYDKRIKAIESIKEALETKEWVGLTDEEITEIRLKTFDAIATNQEIYRAIEAKLKEKNT